MHSEQRVAVGADRVECDIAEVEQSGQADHDVEAPAEHDIGHHQDRDVDDAPVGERHERQRDREEDEDRPDIGCRLADAQHQIVDRGVGLSGLGAGAREPDDASGADGEDHARQQDDPHQHRAVERREALELGAGLGAEQRDRNLEDQERPGEQARADEHRRRAAGAQQAHLDACGEGKRDRDRDVVEAQPVGDAARHVVGADADERHREREHHDGGAGRLLEHGADIERLDDRRRQAQTFSMSGLPSRPVGRKIRTRTSTANAATSLYSASK